MGLFRHLRPAGPVIIILTLLLTGMVVPDRAAAAPTAATSGVTDDPTPYVFNGVDAANPGWVASILADGEYTCTGALIAPEWVLTAAHCADRGLGYSVRIGSSAWSAGTARSVSRVHLHPTWQDRVGVDTDLALLRLTSPVTGVAAPTLATDPTWPHYDQQVRAYGWGQTNTGSGPALTLQAADMYVASGADGTLDSFYCHRPWVADSGYDYFCNGGPVSTWTCPGDSGGPVVGYASPAATGGPFDTIYGVTSFGANVGCSSWQSDPVSQRVSTHLAWIEDITGLALLPPTGPFRDVALSHLFVDEVTWLAATGITRGCNPPDNNRFCPDAPVTRAQMATFLVRALGLPDAGGSGFRDVPANHPHRDDITALAAADITRGCNPPDNNRFCPDAPVTRAQMASFLKRALDLPAAGTGSFRDVPAANPHRADIASLANAGITRGCNPPANTQFCPNQPVSRAQMAAFLQRSLG